MQRFLIASLVALAALSLLLAPWPLWLRIGALAALVAGLVAQWRHGLAEPAPSCVEWRIDGGWWLIWPGAAEPVPAELRQSRVLGALIALDLRVEDGAAGRHLSLRLWPDSADADTLRRLRIRLRNSPLRPGVE